MFPRIPWGILIFLLSALREPHPQMCFPFLVSPSKPLLRVPTLLNPSLLSFPLLGLSCLCCSGSLPLSWPLVNSSRSFPPSCS